MRIHADHQPYRKKRFERMTGYVILPVHTQMAAAISGFYFGGGLAK